MKNGNTSIHSTGLTKEEMEGVADKFHQGLTKREHFAAMAMQGLMHSDTVGWANWASNLAEESVEAADALLKALEETK